MRSRQTRTSVRWQGIHLPLLIIEERRIDTRVSIGKTSAYLRIPYTAPREFKQEKLIWAKKWILETLQENQISPNAGKIKNTTAARLSKPFLKIIHSNCRLTVQKIQAQLKSKAITSCSICLNSRKAIIT